MLIGFWAVSYFADKQSNPATDYVTTTSALTEIKNDNADSLKNHVIKVNVAKVDSAIQFESADGLIFKGTEHKLEVGVDAYVVVDSVDAKTKTITYSAISRKYNIDWAKKYSQATNTLNQVWQKTALALKQMWVTLLGMFDTVSVVQLDGPSF